MRVRTLLRFVPTALMSRLAFTAWPCSEASRATVGSGMNCALLREPLRKSGDPPVTLPTALIVSKYTGVPHDTQFWLLWPSPRMNSPVV